MSLLDLFLLLCILIVSAYTYTKRNVIETFASALVNNRINRLDSKTKKNRNLINSLLERIVVLEEDLNEDDEGGADDFEYQLPDE